VNIKEYISSGIVESCVLGLASEPERAEFEQLCAKYPELVEARTRFEQLLENQAMEFAEAPPVDSKSKIWSAIQQAASSNTTKIITMEPSTTRRSSGTRWVAAASVILMLIAAYFAYDFSSKNKELKRSNEEMTARLNRMDSSINKMKEEQAVIQNPNTTVIQLTALKPGSPSASIYWDTTSASVYMLVKNMPQLASDKQYQLWSIIDSAGKLDPTSLGLFDGGQEKVMIKVNNAQKADAFAITIEKRGNTEGPDLGQLQNMGKTKL
jgi:anti-sigma-K factor RskA